MNKKYRIYIRKERIVNREIKASSMYSINRNFNHINQYKKIRINWEVNFIHILKIMKEYKKEEYFVKLFLLVSTSNSIKRHENSTHVCRNWNHLFEAVKIKETAGRQFKEILVKNDIIRIYSGKNKKLILNPTIFKLDTHISKEAFLCFKNILITKVHPYIIFWLYLSKQISMEELNMIDHLYSYREIISEKELNKYNYVP